MSRGLRTATTWTALALGGWLGCASAGLAQALVISPLPSDVVIGAEGGVVVPAVVSSAQTVHATTLTPADPGLSAMPAALRSDLPRPSIIVGDLAIMAAIGPRGPLGLPFALREAIRQRDAALFERLLERGVFDPDAGRMAEAIQTELQRADCYGGRIDGSWGAGSTRAVERWRQASGDTGGGAGAGDQPLPGLFRAIARGGDMRCAAVVQPVATVAPRGDGGRPGNAAKPGKPRNPAAAAAKPAAAKPATPVQRKPDAPAKPATTAPQFNPSMIGAGVFR